MIKHKYAVAQGKGFRLSDIDPESSAGLDKLSAIEQTVGNTLDMRELQERLYAEGKHAVLIIFQAMDAAGKDSTINHVLSGVNPQGCRVHSFKHPTSEELNHDYLWRCSRVLPERGMIGVFNRSYYEEVLVAKVHPDLILSQNLPHIDSLKDVNKAFWDERYQQIRSYERRLSMNGIRIIKFFLHISKKEQGKRFLKRVSREDKHWKFSSSDLKERAYWDQYQDAYEQCIQHTSTEHAPWHVIPADHKWYARAMVSEIIVEHLRHLDPQIPELDEAEIARLNEAKTLLEKELKKTKD